MVGTPALLADDFFWMLGSLCQLRRVPYKPALLNAARASRIAIASLLCCVLLPSCGKQPEPEPHPLPPDAFLPFEQAQAIGIRCVEAKVRLDAPVTPENSSPQEFTPGVVLHVPKCIYPQIDYAKVKEPIKAKSLEMTFVFPDMTMASEMQGEVEKFLLMQQGKYVPQKDRFPVFVIWMWHVKPDSDSFVPGSKQPDYEFEPRPPRMELNQHCYQFVDGHCVQEMVRIPSRIKGIDAIISAEWAKAHPEALRHDFPKRRSYLAKPESPYELLMDCGAINCQAHLYSKRWHFQLRMVFAAEGVEHADELFRAIDRMLGQWSRPQ